MTSGWPSRRCLAAAGRPAAPPEPNGSLASAAQISKVDDREYIMGEVSQLPGGLAQVNKVVCDSLREWLAETGRAALRAVPAEQRGTSPMQINLASLLANMERNQEAEELFKGALEACFASLGERDMRTVVAMSKYGFLLEKSQRYAEAAAVAQRVLQLTRWVARCPTTRLLSARRSYIGG
jgi:tetratricopeptide (TPR) repeat protein